VEERVRSGSRETSDVLRANGPNSHEFGYEFSRWFAFLLQTRSYARTHKLTWLRFSDLATIPAAARKTLSRSERVLRHVFQPRREASMDAGVLGSDMLWMLITYPAVVFFFCYSEGSEIRLY